MEGAKILIIDDDEDVTGALSALLESRQYNVVTADNRSEGMEKVRIEKPDLLILDVMIETIQDGFEMAMELKSDPAVWTNLGIAYINAGMKEKGEEAFKKADQ